MLSFRESYGSNEKLDILPSIKEIQNFLEEKDSWETPHEYIVEEYFPFENPENPFTTYKLTNITMDIENDGILYFKDLEGILEEAMYNNSPLRLQSIIIDNINCIGISKYLKTITITVDDGFIRINY